MSAVFRHSVSKGAARLMLLAMADEANDEGLLTAYRRSQSHLGGKANVSPATATRAIADLVGLGELIVLERGDGRASSNYRIVLPGLDEGPQDETPGPSSRDPRGSTTTPQGPHDESPIIPLFPDESPVAPALDARPADPLERFDDFWTVVPNKVGKGQARPAWKRAVAKAEPEVIIAGMVRYRDDPNRDASFTAHPTTWLNGERWNDPPLPPRGGAGPSRRERRIIERPDGPARLAEALGHPAGEPVDRDTLPPAPPSLPPGDHR